MLQSFYIQNFKNFEEMVLPSLNRVNLIVGKNSVGKSTLLEAIALYLSGGDENCFRKLLQSRGYDLINSQNVEAQESVKNQFLSFFHNWTENYSKDFCIKLAEQKKNPVTIHQIYIRNLQVNGIPNGEALSVYHQEDLDNAHDLIPVTTGGLKSQSSYGNINIIRYDHPHPFLIKPYKSAPYQMVHTADFRSSTNAQLYDKITLSPLEKYVVKALNIINDNIERISFVTEDHEERSRVPVVSLRDSNRIVRLSSMGDGLNRVLTIVLSLLNAKGGVLLVDEFETGLHYSVQKQLWDIIFMLAEELDIQVFVTSHSSDCLKAFTKSNINNQGLLIRLEQRQTGVVPVLYTDNTDILFATENDIELR